jgi:hypothetical protein
MIVVDEPRDAGTTGSGHADPAVTPTDADARWRTRALGALVALDERLADPAVPVQLTLLLVVLATDSAWTVAVPVVVLAVTGLVVPATTRRMTFWLALAAALAAAAVNKRWQLDNHQFLIVYWCAALGAAAPAVDAVRVRARAARILVGLVFVLAVGWKLLSPDFTQGAFLRYTLLTDPRFSEVATLVGGVAPSDLVDNRARHAAAARPDHPVGPLELRSGPRIDALAHALTGWTLLIEGAVAAAFLVPWRRLGRVRDGALITFVVTTYAVAPVTGFGWVLVAMGLSQADRHRRGVRVAYLAAFLLVQVFVAPWPRLFGLDP